MTFREREVVIKAAKNIESDDFLSLNRRALVTDSKYREDLESLKCLALDLTEIRSKLFDSKIESVVRESIDVVDKQILREFYKIDPLMMFRDVYPTTTHVFMPAAAATRASVDMSIADRTGRAGCILSYYYDTQEFLDLISPSAVIAHRDRELRECLVSDRNPNIVVLNVNAISGDFVELSTNHWVAVVIKEDRAIYVDPLGRRMNDRVRLVVQEAIGDRREIIEAFSGDVHPQKHRLVGHGHIEEIEGNDKDCGPFLIHALNRLSSAVSLSDLRGEIIANVMDESSSQKFGRMLRQEHLSVIDSSVQQQVSSRLELEKHHLITNAPAAGIKRKRKEVSDSLLQQEVDVIMSDSRGSITDPSDELFVAPNVPQRPRAKSLPPSWRY